MGYALWGIFRQIGQKHVTIVGKGDFQDGLINRNPPIYHFYIRAISGLVEIISTAYFITQSRSLTLCTHSFMDIYLHRINPFPIICKLNMLMADQFLAHRFCVILWRRERSVTNAT